MNKNADKIEELNTEGGVLFLKRSFYSFVSESMKNPFHLLNGIKPNQFGFSFECFPNHMLSLISSHKKKVEEEEHKKELFLF